VVRAVSGIVRAQGLRVAVAAVVLALCASCASVPPPKPAPPDPAEETVAAVTQALKLDAAQQKRTRELLKELSDRDDAIRAGWSNGKRVKPEQLVASHGQFERDFFAMLTDEQRRVFIENKIRMMVRWH
jgi:hypothetical protein